MSQLVAIGQIIISIGLVAIIAIQGKGSGLGSTFGGSSLYSTRRGVEKTIFSATIVLVVFFFISSVIQLLI